MAGWLAGWQLPTSRNFSMRKLSRLSSTVRARASMKFIKRAVKRKRRIKPRRSRVLEKQTRFPAWF